jgi:hypothetical protein
VVGYLQGANEMKILIADQIYWGNITGELIRREGVDLTLVSHVGEMVHLDGTYDFVITDPLYFCVDFEPFRKKDAYLCMLEKFKNRGGRLCFLSDEKKEGLEYLLGDFDLSGCSFLRKPANASLIYDLLKRPLELVA